VGINMKKIITVFVGSALVLALANCGAPTAKSIVERIAKLHKFNADEGKVKRIDAELEKQAAEFEKKLAVCSADDLKKIDVELDHYSNIQEREAKAKASGQEDKELKADQKKWEEDPKPEQPCQDAFREVFDALETAAK